MVRNSEPPSTRLAARFRESRSLATSEAGRSSSGCVGTDGKTERGRIGSPEGFRPCPLREGGAIRDGGGGTLRFRVWGFAMGRVRVVAGMTKSPTFAGEFRNSRPTEEYKRWPHRNCVPTRLFRDCHGRWLRSTACRDLRHGGDRERAIHSKPGTRRLPLAACSERRFVTVDTCSAWGHAPERNAPCSPVNREAGPW